MALAEGISHSKVNLFLHVLGKREDGYHDIYTLFYRTGLTDSIFIESANATSLSCNLPYVPTDRRNIILQVDDILRQEYGLREHFSIHIEKSIPVGAGLGGGSGNAACYLKLVDKTAGLNIPMQEMEKIMARLGSDTVFFLGEEAALGEGRGERLRPVTCLPKFHLLLVNPGVHVSTAEIYASPKLILTNKDRLPRIPASITIEVLCSIMWNALQTVTEAVYPVIGRLCNRMSDMGALAAMMSGSGSTVFGIFDNRDDLQEAYIKMKNECPKDYGIWVSYNDKMDK